MQELMKMLDNDEVVTLIGCPAIKALQDYIESQGVDLDDYRMERVDNGVEVWRA